MLKILVTGSSGLVGQELIPALLGDYHQVTRLVRHAPGENEIEWNPEANTLNPQSIEGFDAVIHLAGENIAGHRWTTAQKKVIHQSRIQGTGLIARTIAKLKDPPKVLVSASAIGYYGNRGNEILTEDSRAGLGFLPEVCKDWESATEPTRKQGIRVVNLRFGVILSRKGGALKKMLTPFELGIGGPLGDGKQIMSWVSMEDVIEIIIRAMMVESMSGPVNVVSPNPVTNAEFSKTLGKILMRPWFAAVPTPILKLLMGEMAEELLLSSTNVRPQKLIDAEYEFHHAELESALRAALVRVFTPPPPEEEELENSEKEIESHF